MTSIVVCTHNRQKSLKRTLACLGDLKPSCGVEILVVDNASSDGTRALVHGLMRTRPSLRYVYEPRLGLACALNCAVDHARGEVIAFVDDDETVGEGWAEAIMRAFDDPRTDLIFSRLYTVGEDGRRIDGSAIGFPERDYGDHPIRVVLGENSRTFVFGTGISAYRRSALLEMGSFREDLGRRGSRLFMGEDTEMWHRFLRAGKRVLYWPDAVVFHHIDAHRATWRYTLRKSFDQGVAMTRFAPPTGGRRFLGVPLYCYRVVMTSLLRAVVNGLPRLRGAPRNLKEAAYAAGYGWGCAAERVKEWWKWAKV